MYSIKNFIALIALVSFLELNSEDFDNYEKRTEVKDFIEKMHKKHKHRDQTNNSNAQFNKSQFEAKL